MEVLKSMTAYVLEQKQLLGIGGNTYEDYCNNTSNYAKFLSMPLELKMIVPVDENGNLLEEPEYYELWKNYGSYTQKGESIVPECVKYHKALLEVIFEGFEICIGNVGLSNNENCTIRIHDNGKYSASGNQVIKIEDLVKFNLTLTEQAREKHLL